MSKPPRPLLIKPSNVWDKRLILTSVRKLKEYSILKLFVREDVSPEARQQHAKRKSIPNSTASDAGDFSQSLPQSQPLCQNESDDSSPVSN